MKKNGKLARMNLNKETLRALVAPQLGQVAGGGPGTKGGPTITQAIGCSQHCGSGYAACLGLG